MLEQGRLADMLRREVPIYPLLLSGIKGFFNSQQPETEPGKPASIPAAQTNQATTRAANSFAPLKP